MAKLDKKGNLTLAPHEVLELRGMIYQYGQEVGFRGTGDCAPMMLMRKIRCSLPIHDPEDIKEHFNDVANGRD